MRQVEVCVGGHSTCVPKCPGIIGNLLLGKQGPYRFSWCLLGWRDGIIINEVLVGETGGLVVFSKHPPTLFALLIPEGEVPPKSLGIPFKICGGCKPSLLKGTEDRFYQLQVLICSSQSLGGTLGPFTSLLIRVSPGDHPAGPCLLPGIHSSVRPISISVANLLLAVGGEGTEMQFRHNLLLTC